MTDPTDPAVRRVLVVDDAQEMRLLVRFVLEQSNRFEVVGEAADGAEAIQKATELQPDLVLLDLSMPGMDGLEALPGIIQEAPATTVIVLSAYRRDVMATKVIEAGALGYIEKGTQPKELLTMLHDLMDLGTA